MNKPPISNWSASSLMLYLSNSWEWKLRYIDGFYRNETSATMAVGSAVHDSIRMKLDGFSDTDAMMKNRETLIKGYDGFNKNKTDTLDKVLAKFDLACAYALALIDDQKYFDNCIYHEQVDEEGKMTGKLMTGELFKVNGAELPIGLHGFPDYVWQEGDGDIEVWDWKIVGKHTAKEDEETGELILPARYWIQATIYYYLCYYYFKKAPARVKFREIRTSKPKDGEMLNDYVIECSGEEWEKRQSAFWRLYKMATENVMGVAQHYMPNFGDMFSGQQTLSDFINGYSFE